MSGPQAAGDAPPIPISGLQHAVYCMRQAALIHVERLWQENRFTAEGNVQHAVVDKGGRRHIRGVRRVHSLPLASVRMNLSGIADLVEFTTSADGAEVATPVEFKRGKPKLHRADEVQLCAQALCLEEMTGCRVEQGALFYATARRRVVVPIDADLRDLTEATAAELAAIVASGATPPPTEKTSRCRACSLTDLCRADTFGRQVGAWRDRMITRILDESAP
ncbi:CRISPR-associated protein Cas4 [Tropicimonas sediminicola]|uniref:CRISPR-associated exonuclease Cas4 n=1 Tax=Tropicimonas sediminicola TaxID=1031541 RepID=A0A239MA02_9RHOB|nr:CRISPR-associated protein Cas4 [Tropicimonas sediminicola]SNT39565.1 CRISPR-associated exonuclease, Cas4 family [Tropicimonas sediminicola]